VEEQRPGHARPHMISNNIHDNTFTSPPAWTACKTNEIYPNGQHQRGVGGSRIHI